MLCQHAGRGESAEHGGERRHLCFPKTKPCRDGGSVVITRINELWGKAAIQGGSQFGDHQPFLLITQHIVSSRTLRLCDISSLRGVEL